MKEKREQRVKKEKIGIALLTLRNKGIKVLIAKEVICKVGTIVVLSWNLSHELIKESKVALPTK